MKQFFKQHTWLFALLVVMIALASNLLTGLMQNFFTEHGIGYYLAETGCKYGISIIPICMMVKWGYTGKSNCKKILMGLLMGALSILFCVPNILPLILINPILFKAQWLVLTALILAMFSIGLLEECAVRGVVLPLLCEKWREKKNPYLRAAIASSLIFACIHLNWSVRYFLTHQTLSLDYLSGNLYQVYYTFCFGILPTKTIENYNTQGTLSIQNVFDTYDLFGGCDFAEEIVCGIINLLFVVIGLILIKKVEKGRDIK